MAFKTRIGDILIKAKVIDQLQLRSALAQHDQWGGRLGKVIADMGLADEDTIADVVSKVTGAPRLQLGNLTRDPAALAKIDVTFAEQRMVFPVQLKDNGKVLVLAMADPTDLEVIDLATTRARARIQAAVAGETEIHNAILRYYRNMEPSAVEAPRARKAVRKAEEDAGGEEEEFKVTDMSGKTLVGKTLADYGIDASKLATSPNQNALPGAQKASDLLDEILSGGTAGLSQEEMTRLESVRINQEKSGKIVRALIELLTEKGYLTGKDIQARMRG